MLKLSQLDRVLKMQAALGLTGVHYHAHGSEPSDPVAQARFHARRLGLSENDPAAASAGTNGLMNAHLARVAMNKAVAGNPRDAIMTREFWATPSAKQPKPGI